MLFRSTAMLLRVAAAQEKFYLQNNAYTTTLTGANSLNLDSATEHGWYLVTVLAGASGIGVGYTATAAAVSGQPQFKDTDCRSFSITETGARGALKSDNSTNSTTACWR